MQRYCVAASSCITLATYGEQALAVANSDLQWNNEQQPAVQWFKFARLYSSMCAKEGCTCCVSEKTPYSPAKDWIGLATGLFQLCAEFDL